MTLASLLISSLLNHKYIQYAPEIMGPQQS